MAQVNEKEQLVFDIAQAEWELFQLVENTGGRASCQDDPDTFFKMRMSQWMIFSTETLKSYMADLQNAADEGRNLIFEKYGYMMETTYPKEYAQIKKHLPEVSEEAGRMIDEIARIHVQWDQKVYEKYQHVRENGRAFRTGEDNVFNGSSSESYLRGEYKTYSLQTLKLIYEQVLKAEKTGENLLEKIVENEVRFYGYQSLQEAEEKQCREERAFAWSHMDDSAVCKVMRKAVSGQPVTVAALGGSITEGFYSSDPDKSYAGIMKSWWEEKFPNTTVHYINAGIGATDSYLGLHRVQRDVLAYDPDFVIVDFTVNDQAEAFYGESYEKLIRTLLASDSKPAVVLLFMTMEDGTNAQSFHAKVGEKYRLPMISYGNVVLAEIKEGKYLWSDISPDDIHPNDRGHAIAGGLVRAYLDRIYRECMEGGLVTVASRSGIEAVKADILDSENTEPVADGGWHKADLHPHLHHGWEGNSENDALEFELEFANLGITYWKSVDGDFGKAEIYVDGRCVRELDGNFPGGWGNYGQSDEVYTSEETAVHEIEIKVKAGENGEIKKFGVLALLVSE